MRSDNPLSTAHVDVASGKLSQIKSLRSDDQLSFTPFVIFLTVYHDLALCFFILLLFV